MDDIDETTLNSISQCKLLKPPPYQAAPFTLWSLALPPSPRTLLLAFNCAPRTQNTNAYY